jgi:uncharacterized protein (DUF433 family)
MSGGSTRLLWFEGDSVTWVNLEDEELMMPTSEYIETKNGGYYVVGSRICLDVVAHAFRRGRTAEDIFRSFPSIGSLAKVYGVLTFILEHHQAIENYLRDEHSFYEEFQTSTPLPPEMLEPFERARDEKASKIA